MSDWDERQHIESELGIAGRHAAGSTIRGPLHGWHSEPDLTPHTVYLHVTAGGTVLYAGCTKNLEQRTAAHERKAPWWPYVDQVMVIGTWPRHIALGVEKGLIAHYDPPGNFVGTPAWRADMSARFSAGPSRETRREVTKPLAYPRTA